MKTRQLEWTRKAADIEPKEYAYRLGRLLYNENSIEDDSNLTALDCWEKACEFDDWRGAAAISEYLSRLGKIMEKSPDITKEELNEVRQEEKYWQERAMEILTKPDNT